MRILQSLVLAALAALASSCAGPETCHSYAYGPAYGADGYVFPRPSHVVAHGYPSYFEPVYHRREPVQGVGPGGYGTNCNAQIPYLLR